MEITFPRRRSFLSLPGEIHNQIYSEFFDLGHSETDTFYQLNDAVSPIFKVNDQIEQEARSLYERVWIPRVYLNSTLHLVNGFKVVRDSLGNILQEERNGMVLSFEFDYNSEPGSLDTGDEMAYFLRAVIQADGKRN
jgi:hypothetical protein